MKGTHNLSKDLYKEVYSQPILPINPDVSTSGFFVLPYQTYSLSLKKKYMERKKEYAPPSLFFIMGILLLVYAFYLYLGIEIAVSIPVMITLGIIFIFFGFYVKNIKNDNSGQ